MAKTWSPHGPSNWFILNHNQYAPGSSMPNFTILGVSHYPLFLEMAKIWPFYGQNMVLTWSFKLFFLNHNQCSQGLSMTNFTILGSSQSQLFLKMAKIWPYHGQTHSS